MPDKLWHKRGARVKLPKISKVLLFPCLISSLFSKQRSLQLHETSKQRNPCYFMHIIYTYHHHQRWISNECDYTNVPTIISNSKTIRVKKIYFYTENKRKERNCWTRFLFYPRANSRMITRWSGKEDWQETKFNHPRLLPVEGSEKKKGGKGRETEMNRFGHGGRQKRLIIGQVRVKVENLSAARPLESIVRKVSCDTTIPVGRGERLSEKKEKEKKKRRRAR